ncbi:hypothetical protein [Actinomadura sp. 6N118]|uniref:hypothetical protein n=1 Tax=Actinomadura sp. 6N118 TaxID=3375151 RepID=UPI0037ADF754
MTDTRIFRLTPAVEWLENTQHLLAAVIHAATHHNHGVRQPMIMLKQDEYTLAATGMTVIQNDYYDKNRWWL